MAGRSFFSPAVRGSLLLAAQVLLSLALFAVLQYRLWLSDEGMREVWHLDAAVAAQRADNAVLAERNAQQKAEVADLKQGLTAVEERARHDLRQPAREEVAAAKQTATRARRAARGLGVKS